jgi:hypothetical protein
MTLRPAALGNMILRISTATCVMLAHLNSSTVSLPAGGGQMGLVRAVIVLTFVAGSSPPESPRSGTAG